MKPYICKGSLIEKSLQPYILIRDCLSCEVKEELNGMFELELTVPFNSEYAEIINIDSYIMAEPNPVDEYQFFKVYKKSNTLGEKLSIYAEHIRYALNHYICPMVYGSNISELIDRINSNITYANCPFKIFTDKSTAVAKQITSVQSIGSILMGNKDSILDTYGGEWQFSNYTCMLWNSRGKDRNIALQYGYDIESYSQEIELVQGYTHIFPYYEWSLSNGEISTITLSHKSLESKYPTILTRDLIQIDDTYKSDEPMRIYMLNLAEIYSLDLTVGYWTGLNIQSMAEYWLEENKNSLLGYNLNINLGIKCIQDNKALNRCGLGDIIRIRVPSMKIEQSAKIRSYQYDVIKEMYISLEIGTLSKQIDRIISNQSIAIAKNTNEIARRTGQILNKDAQ